MADESSTTTVVTVTGMVLASLGAGIAALFSYLSGKNKQKFDAEFATLRKDHEECEAERAVMKTDLLAVNTRCTNAEHKAFVMEGELAGAKNELVALRADVDKLRQLLYSRTGG